MNQEINSALNKQFEFKDDKEETGGELDTWANDK